MARAAKTVDISEAKIRNAIWYLKKGKTKKFVCEFLGMPYNTKKLDGVINDFHKKQEREAELKKKAKTKVFTKAEKDSIAKDYLSGETQSAIAKTWYVSPQRIKNVLIELGVPLRARGKKAAAKVDHIIQDLEVKFNKGEKVFIAKHNCFGIIKEVFDEDYLDFLENGRQQYRETYPFTAKSQKKFIEPQEGIHYEIYWCLEDGKEMKLNAMLNHRDYVNKVIEDTGREFYRVWRDDEQGGFYNLYRDQIFPIRTV